MKKFITAIMIFGIFFSFCSEAKARKTRKKINFTAKAAIIVNCNQNRIIFSKNPHLRLAPASTAKIMTALLVIENLGLENNVSASRNACNQQPSKVYLKPGVNYKVGDLLHAVLMSSANDAACCLAEAVAGSEWEFAKKMNKRARELGCKNSNFVNSSGLPTKSFQYSSVYDLSLIIRKLVKYPKAVQVMQRKSYSFFGSDGGIIQCTNHNKLLWKFPGVAIGKTGYTKKARHCFVGNDILDKKEVVFALLGSQSLWSDVKYLLRKAGCIK